MTTYSALEEERHELRMVLLTVGILNCGRIFQMVC